MSLRRRDEYTHWSNDVAIADLHETLSILQIEYGDSGKRYVYTDDNEPHIRIDWYREGSSGGDSAGTRYYEVKPEIIATLAKEGLVEKMRVPQIGYTYFEPYKFVLSEKGAHLLIQLNQEKKEVARSLLIPGEHSKFSGIFNDAGYDREYYRGYGRLYFDFVTPMQEKVRVYPDTKEVKKLEPEKV